MGTLPLGIFMVTLGKIAQTYPGDLDGWGEACIVLGVFALVLFVAYVLIKAVEWVTE